jgi:hypothetical protein
MSSVGNENQTTMAKKEMNKYIFSWTELIEAASQGGCLICNAVEKKLQLTYRRMLGEEIINPECREQIRTGLGFCQWHAHRLLEIEEKNSHDNYLMALFYADLLSHLLPVMQKLAAAHQLGRKSLSEDFSDFFDNSGSEIFNPPSSSSCRVCQAKRTHEEFFIGEFLRYLESAEFVEVYQRYAWLCLPHLFQVVAYPLPAKYRHLVFDLQLSQLEKLMDQLKSYQEQIFKATKTAISDWINSPQLGVETVRGKLM